MMKRLGLLLCAVGALTGCQAPSSSRDDASAEPSAWLRPPQIDSVRREGGRAIVSGRADPGARVVLRGEAGAAFAAAADREGRFVVRVAETGGDLILTPEVQNGQDAAASPDRLALLASGASALLRAGGATWRLDPPAEALDVVDFDGQVILASGRASAGEPVTVKASGQTLSANTDAQGRWSLILPAGTLGFSVGTAAYVLPSWVNDGISPSNTGQTVNWHTSDGVLQQSWLPQNSGRGLSLSDG